MAAMPARPERLDPNEEGRLQPAVTTAPGSRQRQRELLGEAIRTARQKLGWTLRELSSQAGVSISQLSQVERGSSDPSLETLRDVADALGTSPFSLLAGPPASTGLVRAGTGTRLSLPGSDVEFELITPSMDKSFEVVRFTLGPGGRSMREPRGHPGEEAVFLVTGSARFDVGDESYVLYPGDLLMWDARIPHRGVALSVEPVTGFMVIAPPTF